MNGHSFALLVDFDFMRETLSVSFVSHPKYYHK